MSIYFNRTESHQHSQSQGEESDGDKEAGIDVSKVRLSTENMKMQGRQTLESLSLFKLVKVLSCIRQKYIMNK